MLASSETPVTRTETTPTLMLLIGPPTPFGEVINRSLLLSLLAVVDDGDCDGEGYQGGVQRGVVPVWSQEGA